jgi:hypothetical protein
VTELGILALAMRAQPYPMAAFLKHSRGRLGVTQSFRSMSEPGRISAPGFVLGAVGSPGVRSDTDVNGSDPTGPPWPNQADNHEFSTIMFLPTQPADEKSPVNFLLFTERVIFALPSVVRWRNRRTGLHD